MCVCFFSDSVQLVGMFAVCGGAKACRRSIGHGFDPCRGSLSMTVTVSTCFDADTVQMMHGSECDIQISG